MNMRLGFTEVPDSIRILRKEDLVATNGVIHAIDAVIMPKNWQLLAAAA